MSDHREIFPSGRDYFDHHFVDGLLNGTFVIDTLGIIHRSITARQLPPLAGHEPRPLLTDKQNEELDAWLHMPPLYFDE